jgi:hypothetical protein
MLFVTIWLWLLVVGCNQRIGHREREAFAFMGKRTAEIAEQVAQSRIKSG